MVQKKESKTLALLVAALVVAMAVVTSLSLFHEGGQGEALWHAVGLFAGSPPWQRLFYPFFHASPLHALINAWCLLSLVFLYDVSLWRLLAAYIVAVTVPGPLLSGSPVVGLSCACFFLIGSLVFLVRRRLCFFTVSALYVAAGFLFPSVASLFHLYGYVAGLFVGFITTPFSCIFRK